MKVQNKGHFQSLKTSIKSCSLAESDLILDTKTGGTMCTTASNLQRYRLVLTKYTLLVNELLKSQKVLTKGDWKWAYNLL